MRISDWSSDVCSSDRPSLLPVRHWSPKSLHDREECPKCQRSSPPCLIRYIRLPTCASCSPTSCASLLTSCDRKRSEEHTSELQSLMRNSYAVFCLKKKKTK